MWRKAQRTAHNAQRTGHKAQGTGHKAQGTTPGLNARMFAKLNNLP